MSDIAKWFPTDSPVPADSMIGRGHDVEELAASLLAGTNVVLAGPRRTGKTSVAYAALERVRQEGVYTAGVELFRRRDTADLAAGLVEAILENRSGLHRVLARARAAAGAALDAATITVSAKLSGELGEAAELAFRPGLGARDPERALASALELPQRIAAADGKRIILFLDEFQDLAAPGHPFGDPDRLTKQMRAIFQRSPLVTLLFAGSIEHVMRDLFGPRERALSQFGSFRALSAISREEWRAGLAPRFEQAGAPIEPDALEMVAEAGEGHPRSTMLIARETLTAALADRSERVGVEHARAGWQLAVGADRLRHEQVLERIRLAKHAQAVAMRIARGQRPYPGLGPSAAQRALRALELAGVAETPARGEWRITDPLLRDYLRHLPGP
ncbi:MAG TPA: hypothetical protein VGH24_01660 [Solirubrobacteraceae bacterium]